MKDTVSQGKVLVAIQFALLAALLFAPRPAGIVIPGLAYIGGQVMFLGGIVVVALGFRALGSTLTANPVPLESGELVTTGVYRRVRHPIYAGLILLTFGMTLDSWNPFRLVIWLLLVALLQYKIRFEETLLLARYQGYANYKAEVPALIPSFRG